jgi:outer membrane biosynthesis protein TonB
MPSIEQQIRNGFVELRTHKGSAYVSPSFWQRIYLLWTFRNFQSLPRQVLNRRQQQLIDKLCRAAIVNQNRLVARASIIGAVENVQLLPDYRTEAAASTSKVVEIGTINTEVAEPPAVGSESISVRSNRAACNRIDIRRFTAQSGDIHRISAPKQVSVSAEQSEPNEVSPASVDSAARRTRTRNNVGWALAAALVAALVGAFFFREARLAPPKKVAQVGIEAQLPVSATIFPVAAQQPEKLKQQLPAVFSQPSTITALKPPSSAIPSRRHESSNRKAVIPSQPPVENMDSTPPRRLQVAEAPENGFSYPVAPSPTMTGKVSLMAIIGTDGAIKEVDILSGNRALADAAVRVVRQWRYHPHDLDGHAVEAETHILISFVGSDAVSISFPAVH